MQILVVDDDRQVGEMVAEYLQTWAYEARFIPKPRKALEFIRAGHAFDLVLTDLQMPEMNGQELLSEIRTLDPSIEVVVMTGYATVDSAVQAMRQGALDYITKPINFGALGILLDRLKQTRALSREVESLRLELQKEYSGGARAALIGSSLPIRQIIKTVRNVSENKATVLIRGESGTGKELIARALHYSGHTADKPFLALNCGGISPSLLESQLFGHVKGAFTNAHAEAKGYFRAADGGTLLLDEITEMDKDLQVKLLRVLQEREVTPVGATQPIPIDVRIVAATNQSLEEAVRTGRMREDLYYRLSVVIIEMPPLRERRDDIPDLVKYFNNRFSEEFGVQPKRVPHETLERLMQHDWPGNVRELENVLMRAFALAEEEVRLPSNFPGDGMGTGDAPSSRRVAQNSATVAGDVLPSWSEAEKVLIAAGIKRVGNDKIEARETLRNIHEIARTLARGWDLAGEVAPAGPYPGSSAGEAADTEAKGATEEREAVPTWEEAEQRLLRQALGAAKGIKSQAAKLLDIDARRLNRLLERHGMME